MFTWICPQCGREVPPSYTECPDCAERAKAAPPPQQQPGAPQAQPPQAAPPPQPTYYPPPQQTQQAPPQQAYYPPQQQQQYAPPQYSPPRQQPYAPPQQQQYPPPPPTMQYGPPPSRGLNMPVWLLTILFAAGLGGIIFGIYSLMQTNRAQTGNGPAPTAAVESPAAKPGAKTNPVQKFIEVSGVRFVQDAKKKTQVRFLLINHSDSDLSNLAGNVTIWGRTKKSEEDAEGTFSFSTNLGPQESKELTVPLNTKLKIYELPDWQNVTTDVQITAPTG